MKRAAICFAAWRRPRNRRHGLAQSAPVASRAPLPPRCRTAATPRWTNACAGLGPAPEEWARYRQLMQGPLGIYPRTSIR